MKYLLQNKKLELIFIVTNILVLITIIGIYTYRLVYYYKLDNPKVDTKNLVELLTLEKNIVSGGNGLHKIDNKYIYKGEVENNYVRYSGLLFQVYEINDNEIKMISYDNLMVLEKDINFNNTIKKLDIVIDTLKNKEEYLNEIGFESISLGSRIMRAETASIYITSIINYLFMRWANETNWIFFRFL